MLLPEQLLNDAPATATTSLTAFGTVFTTVTWALLIAINLWCLRKLFRNQPAPVVRELGPAASAIEAERAVLPEANSQEAPVTPPAADALVARTATESAASSAPAPSA